MTNIEFHKAIEISKQVDIKNLQKQKETLQEFLSSKCDLFTSQDWFYYAETTGKSIPWLRENAIYSDPAGEYGTLLTNAMLDNDYELIEEFFV